jgi:hypothetical protein
MTNFRNIWLATSCILICILASELVKKFIGNGFEFGFGWLACGVYEFIKIRK